MATEPQILSSFSPRACPRCMLTCFSAGDPDGTCLSQRVLSRPSTSVEDPLQISSFYAKQTQFPKGINERKLNNNN